MKGAKQVTLDESKHLVELLETDLIINRTVAIDGGAHVGVWTRILANHFNQVHAFEPHPKGFDYLKQNCDHIGNAFLYNNALMDKECGIDVYAPGRTTLTATQVRYNAKSEITAMAIDSLQLPELGFLKLDVEGAELKALMGAEQTIKRCRPFILVELNNLGGRFGVKDRDVRAWLAQRGYAEVWARGCDVGFIYA